MGWNNSGPRFFVWKIRRPYFSFNFKITSGVFQLLNTKGSQTKLRECRSLCCLVFSQQCDYRQISTKSKVGDVSKPKYDARRGKIFVDLEQIILKCNFFWISTNRSYWKMYLRRIIRCRNSNLPTSFFTQPENWGAGNQASVPRHNNLPS